MLRKKLLIAVLVVIFTVSFVACGQNNSNVDNQPAGDNGQQEGKDILIVAARALPPGIDTDFHTTLEALEMEANLYETLLGWERVQNENGTWMPDFENIEGLLAEKWWRSDDGKTVFFKLREGVKSNFGNELTAEDVKWDLDRAWDLKGVGWFHVYTTPRLENNDGVKVVDKYTVSITTKEPSFIMDTIFTHIINGIVDSTEAKKHATTDDPWATKWLASNAATFGPYMIEEWSPGKQIVLVENPNYYRGPLKVKKIIYREIPNSANRLAMLKSGAVDVFEWPLPEEVVSIKGAKNINIESCQGNMSIRIEPSFTHELLKNLKVRQVLAYAFPYQEVMDTVFRGTAQSMDSAHAKMYPYYVPSYKYKYDLDKAKSLLVEAGYPEGFSVPITIDSNRTDHERIAMLYKTSLAKIGVDLQIEKLPSGDLYSRRSKHELALYINMDMAGFPDPQFAIGTFMLTGNGANYNDYSNQEVDRLFEEAAATLDQEIRSKSWEGMQKIFGEEVGWIMVAEPGFYLPVRDNVQGLTWTTLNGIDFRHAEKN
ncbi:MAG: ABC transporter substrate-binding protein [Dysgonamonadaceae bacterium]|nr:ABC transporter substrate-binding protein [Dysgonamonadaceae bacterium]